METAKLIAAIRDQRARWSERFMELNGNQTELVASSFERLARSRHLLYLTHRQLRRGPAEADPD